MEARCSSAGGERPVWEGGSEWVDVRRFGPQLQASDAGLLAYARGMVEWQSRNVCLFVFLLITLSFFLKLATVSIFSTTEHMVVVVVAITLLFPTTPPFCLNPRP